MDQQPINKDANIRHQIKPISLKKNWQSIRIIEIKPASGYINIHYSLSSTKKKKNLMRSVMLNNYLSAKMTLKCQQSNLGNDILSVNMRK